MQNVANHKLERERAEREVREAVIDGIRSTGIGMSLIDECVAVLASEVFRTLFMSGCIHSTAALVARSAPDIARRALAEYDKDICR